MTHDPFPPARRGHGASPPSTKILIVDDEPVNVELLSRLMARSGYAVVTASNGVEALAAAAREYPDVVLLDVNMPGLDGFEVCRRLKEARATRLTPVVLVTSFAALEDAARLGRRIGLDDHQGTTLYRGGFLHDVGKSACRMRCC